MNVFVTGATGFIGHRLCHWLVERGYQVVATCRDNQRLDQLKAPNIHPVHCDILDREALRDGLRDCQCCVHLAALAKSWSADPQGFQRVNVEGTRNVLATAQERNLNRVIFTSTASVFGPAKPEAPRRESDPFAQQLDTAYERSKLACQPIVDDFRARGLDIITLYPTRVFGPGQLSQSNVLTEIFKKYAAGTWRWIPGDGKSFGNFVFIEDVLSAIQMSLNYQGKATRFLIGGENLTFDQLFQELQKAVGHPTRMVHVPPSILMLIAWISKLNPVLFGKPPGLTPEFVRKYLKDWCIDISLAQNELDYQPTPIDDAIRQTLEWLFRSQNHPDS